MDNKIKKRLETLIEEGKIYVDSLPLDKYGITFWTRTEQLPQLQSWVNSSANIVEVITPKTSSFRNTLSRTLSDENLDNGVPSHTVQKLQGLLESVNNEVENGVLKDVEFIVFATAFDDFLDHAQYYHKGGKRIEASILSSTVLEDTVKKIASKNGIDTSNKSLEKLIDLLIKKDVFTTVKGKRIKGLTGVRNKALHAEWDEDDIKDVGEQIKGLRDLINDYL